jgi:hypothetical protein
MPLVDTSIDTSIGVLINAWPAIRPCAWAESQFEVQAEVQTEVQAEVQSGFAPKTALGLALKAKNRCSLAQLSICLKSARSLK